MRIGLVLGAGGIQGGAWLVGGLDALASETGWDPMEAEVIVGTSAGSMIGALVSAGVPPWFMVAHSRGEELPTALDANGDPAAEADRSGGTELRLDLRSLPIGPGSLQLAVRSLLRPTRHTPAAVISGWLPDGIFSTEPLREEVRHAVPGGWSPHPGLWVVACDYASGGRVKFGHPDAPPAELADAVAASCAIPGIYRPVDIEGRKYVDGGVYSTSNLDVVGEVELDLVICLNPTSTLHPIRALNPRDVAALLFHRSSGRRLGREARRLRDRALPVVLVQPTRSDLDAMGLNLMSGARRNRVIEVARETVAEQLRAPENRGLLEGLPRASRPEKVRRPSGPPEGWPPLDLRRMQPA